MEQEASGVVVNITSPDHLYALEDVIQTSALPLVFQEAMDGEDRREVPYSYCSSTPVVHTHAFLDEDPCTLPDKHYKSCTVLHMCSC